MTDIIHDSIRELLAKTGENARSILRLFKEDRFPEHEMFEDGVIELCRWVLQLEQHVRNLLEKTKKPEPTVKCKRCGGFNVQMAMWVDPNTNEIMEDFGSFDEQDTKWCNDCDSGEELVDTSIKEEPCPSSE